MNSVCIAGRLCKDPDYTKAKKGKNPRKSFARFTVAVSRPYKNDDGEYDADFISVKAFGGTADFVNGYFKKGTWIAVQGSINTGSYDNENGETVYTTDVFANNISFVGDKKDA